MDKRGRPKLRLVLSPSERQQLEQVKRRRVVSQNMITRARIVLLCAKGLSNQQVARELDISRFTVGRWRQRFVKHRLRGLQDEPRSGAPRKIEDQQVVDVIYRTLRTAPDKSMWTTRQLARRTGLSNASISRIWRAFDLSPQAKELVSIGPDNELMARIQAFQGLFLSPSQRAMAITACAPGQGTTEVKFHGLNVSEYERCTDKMLRWLTTLDLSSGRLSPATTTSDDQHLFHCFLDNVDAHAPSRYEVPMFVDGLNPIRVEHVTRWLNNHPRIRVLSTKSTGEWLLLVSRWLSLLASTKLSSDLKCSTREFFGFGDLQSRRSTRSPVQWVYPWNSARQHAPADQRKILLCENFRNERKIKMVNR